MNKNKILLHYSEYMTGKKVTPDTVPMEAMYSTNLSIAGNGDFPRKYGLVRSLVQALNANS